MKKEDWMPWTKTEKGNPQQQVILGERRAPGVQSMSMQAAGSGVAQPMPVAPQQNAGVMPPREMQQSPSQQGWADQSSETTAPRKGLFSFFSRKGEPEANEAMKQNMTMERRKPMLNEQGIGGNAMQAAPVAGVATEEKPFPKLATVPTGPAPTNTPQVAAENIRKMEQERAEMAESLPPAAPAPMGAGMAPPPPPPGMMPPPPPPPPPGAMPPPPPAPVAMQSSGDKDYPVHRWADNPVPQTLDGGVTAPMPAPIQPQSPQAYAPQPAPAPAQAAAPEVKPQVANARWVDADTSGQVQKVEVPTSTDVVGVPPAPTPAEPIVLAPRSVVSGGEVIPESRYASRRRAE